jgi:hypothetical protein
MKRKLAATLYWFAAITITLGAYGHGFVGVKPIQTAVAASTLAPDVVRVIWIVWYFVSGCMVSFGNLLFWAWAALKSGSSSRSSAAIIIGVFYAVAGVTSYFYSGRKPFWLRFLIPGAVVIGSAVIVRRHDPPRRAPVIPEPR